MAKAKWTWLVYMAGDNNLEGAGKADLAEMKRVGSTDQLNVVVQFDTEENKTTRYRVEKGKLKTLATMPGVNSGDPKVLTDFIKWGMKSFPAEHYLLDIWNHGGGWENLPADYDYNSIRAAMPKDAARRKRLKRALFRSTVKQIHKLPPQARAIAIDCGAHDYLDNQELRKAVAKALPPGTKLDILACDACLMNMLEIAYEMKDTAKLMVGSEETEPGAGWPYADILKALAAKPAMSPEQLAKLAVEQYGKYFKRAGEAVTQSALDLARIPAISSAVNKLADALIANMPAVAGPAALARASALKFDMPEYIDLGDFAAQLSKRLQGGGPVSAAAAEVQAQLGANTPTGFVIGNVSCGARMARASGVSIYFPQNEDYAKDYGDLLFSQQGKWKDFLGAMRTA